MSEFIFNFTESDGTPVKESVTAESLIEPLLSAVSEISSDLDDDKQSYHELGKFVEDPKRIQDESEYQRTGKDPGLVIIFNQQKVENEKTRHGTNRDVNELILTFGRLGYNVDPRNVRTDLTRKQIISKLADLSNEDHSDKNCLIVVVLTHGNTGGKLLTKDGPIFTWEIWQPFIAKNCPDFAEKPKFFIFQACKGSRFSQHNTSETDIIPNDFYTTCWEPDMLVAFAAVEGSQSYRHAFNGTWFIQEMCRNFSAFGRRDDVVSLLIRTTKCVANNYYHHVGGKDVPVRKQMPLFISTLSKKFYLTKSKDRHLLLQLIRQQQEIVKTLKDVQEKVDVMYENYQGGKKQRQQKS